MKKQLLILLTVMVSITVMADKHPYRKIDTSNWEVGSMKDALKVKSGIGFEFDDPTQPSPMKSTAAIGTPVYTTPQGTLYVGLAEDMDYFYTMYMGMIKKPITIACAAPFATWTFENKTAGGVDGDFFWEYGGLEDMVIYNETTRDLVREVTASAWEMPRLYTDTEVYQFGTSAPREHSDMEPTFMAQMYASGGTVTRGDDEKKFHMSNLCLDYDIVMWTIEDENHEVIGYRYGTGSKTEELVAFYDAPAAGLLYFEDINVFYGHCSGPADAEFYLNVVKAERNGESGIPVLGEIVATSTFKIKDIEEGYPVLRFRNFQTLDGNDVDFFEMDGSFALVLGGYNETDVKLGVMTEYEKRADGVNYAFVNIMRDGTKVTTQYKDSPTTMFFQLVEAHYTYLMEQELFQNGQLKTGKDIEVYVPLKGGKAYTMLFPYFAGVWQKEQELPEWLTASIEERYTTDSWGAFVTFTVEESDEERSFELEYETYGARANVILKQVETVPVRAVAYNPPQGVNGVPVNYYIEIAFNEPVNINAVPDLSNVSIKDSKGNAVAVTASYKEKIVTIYPANLFDYDTEYTVTIPVGSIEGCDEEVSCSFTTASEEVGMEDTKENDSISVYPTLTSGEIKVITPSSAKIKVLDVAGKMLETYVSTGEKDIVLDYNNGVYIILVETQQNVSANKVILRR